MTGDLKKCQGAGQVWSGVLTLGIARTRLTGCLPRDIGDIPGPMNRVRLLQLLGPLSQLLSLPPPGHLRCQDLDGLLQVCMDAVVCFRQVGVWEAWCRVVCVPRVSLRAERVLSPGFWGARHLASRMRAHLLFLVLLRRSRLLGAVRSCPTAGRLFREVLVVAVLGGSIAVGDHLTVLGVFVQRLFVHGLHRNSSMQPLEVVDLDRSFDGIVTGWQWQPV